MEIDFFTKSDIQTDINQIVKIINTGIFNPENSEHPLIKSAFIETLICLRDLMYKTEKFSSRISFTDDVLISSKIRDVSDLIRFVRDALCHNESNNHFIGNSQNKVTFCIAYGKCNLFAIDNINISFSEYEDDVCFFFGEQRIYLKRHILRAFEETKQKLLPLI